MADVRLSTQTRRRNPPPGPLQRLKKFDGTPAAFGAIRFTSTKRPPAKWACVSKDASIDDVVGLLTETWGLPRPPVIISVTGAAAGLANMRARDKAIFRRGLRSAARATSAWIVTGGTNAGVMAMVGKMMAESDEARDAGASEQTVCLGIAPLGAIYKHEELLEQPKGKVRDDRHCGGASRDCCCA